MDKEIENFRRETRNSIYDYIDDDVSNDDFKRKLEALLNQNVQNLQNKLPNVIKSSFNEFESMVQQDLSNFARKANETINELQSVNIGSFSVNIDIKSGVDKMGLLTGMISVGMAASISFANFWNPLGWAVFISSALTALIKLYKSLRIYFDTEYKKSEQKKNANNNIANISKHIKDNIASCLEKGLEQIRVGSDEIVANLHLFVESAQNTEELIIENIEKLEKVFEYIKNSGEKYE